MTEQQADDTAKEYQEEMRELEIELQRKVQDVADRDRWLEAWKEENDWLRALLVQVYSEGIYLSQETKFLVGAACYEDQPKAWVFPEMYQQGLDYLEEFKQAVKRGEKPTKGVD